MSPTLSIDPDAVVAVASTVDAASDASGQLRQHVAGAASQAEYPVDALLALPRVGDELTLVARTLRLRAELAANFSISPARFRLADELGTAEAALGALLTEPGRTDAADLAALLQAIGPIGPNDLIERDGLRKLIAHEPELAAAFARLQRHAGDPAYLADFYGALTPEQIHQLVETVNAAGYATSTGRLDADTYADLLVPFARTLGIADRAGLLDPAVRSALLDLGPGNPSDPRYRDLGLTEQQQAEAVLDERRRMLALLVNAGSFSPSFTAAAASTVLATGPITDFWRHEGFHGGHPELALTDLVALHAVAGDDAAVTAFVTTDADGDGWYENAGMLTRMGSFNDYAINDAAAHTGDPATIRDDLVTTSSTILERGLLVIPLSTGTLHDPAQAVAFASVVGATGMGDVDDRLKRTIALVSAPYSKDLALSFADHPSGNEPTGLPTVTRDDVRAFMKELTYDPVARTTLAANAAAFLTAVMRPDLARYAAGDSTALAAETSLAAEYYAAFGQGLDDSNTSTLARREALVKGFRLLSDPLTDLAVGKVPGAELPVISALVDTAKESIVTSVYDVLIPKPQLEAMTDWQRASADDVYRTLGTIVWNDPALRVRLGGPDDATIAALRVAEPAVLSALRDQFANSNQVRDFQHAVGDKVIDELSLKLAFEKVFGS